MVVDSELTLPQLRSLDPQTLSSDDANPVIVRWGDVPERLSEELPIAPITRWGESCLLRIPDAGNYLVTANSVTIEKHNHASLDDVEAYLLGTVLATVAHLRGLVPLHVSAVLSPMGAIAFTGESGAGKSTMAAHIHHKTGWPLISDDVSALYVTETGVALESGVLTVKLWKDALASLDRSSEGLKRDAERMDKFHAIDAEKFVVGRYPLKSLVFLQWGDEDCVTAITGRQALEIAIASVYRPELVNLCRNRERVVANAIALARSVDVKKVTRRKGVPVTEGILNSLKAVDFTDVISPDAKADA
jgi:hypothetical protein